MKCNNCDREKTEEEIAAIEIKQVCICRECAEKYKRRKEQIREIREGKT